MGQFHEGIDDIRSQARDDRRHAPVYGFEKMVVGVTFMPVLKSKLDVASAAYSANRRAMEALVEELREHTTKSGRRRL